VVGGGEEADGTGTFQRLFVYGNCIDEVLRMTDDSDDDYYYLHDHLYSPVALLDDDGDVVERYEYDVYGACRVHTDDGADDIWLTGDDTIGSSSAKDKPYLFTGRRLDILDGGSLTIQYNRNRYYDPETGRWLTHDPLGITLNAQISNSLAPVAQYAGGMNLYGYVLDNPVRDVDPFGLVACPGGNWWIHGDMFFINAVFVQGTSSVLTFTCTQQQLIGKRNCECCELPIQQRIWKRPYAAGDMDTGSITFGAAAGRAKVWGHRSGAANSEDLDGWQWSGPGYSLSVLVGHSGGNDIHGVSLGLQAGASVSIIGLVKVDIWADGYKIIYEKLGKAIKEGTEGCPCSCEKTQWFDGPWEGVPKSERPGAPWKKREE